MSTQQRQIELVGETDDVAGIWFVRANSAVARVPSAFAADSTTCNPARQKLTTCALVMM